LSSSSEPLAYAVVVDDVSGGEVANLIRGYVIFGEERIRFTGIAYGRIGGQNVFPKLSRAAKKRIRQLWGNSDKFEENLQLRLVKGDFEIKPKQAQGPG
jgi:hypothetical protein